MGEEPGLRTKYNGAVWELRKIRAKQARLRYEVRYLHGQLAALRHAVASHVSCGVIAKFLSALSLSPEPF